MSREEAIEILSEMRAEYNLFGDEEEATRYHVLSWAIQAMKAAQRWIPVSERLPNPDEEVFVYLWGNVPHLASVNSEGQWETDQFYLDADDTPKAWMPLPEPWKGEEDGALV